MSIASKPRLMTAEEFMKADLGEGLHELVRGEVVDVTPPPNTEHGFVCANLTYYLSDFARRTGLGYCLSNDSAVQTTRGPDTVRGADVCFYSEARQPRSQVGSKLSPIAPDLVIEVVSPGNRRGEMFAKVAEYLDAGVLAVWLVYPRERSVVIHRERETAPVVLKEGDAIEDQPELPGFRCQVSDLFA
ncbi:Uma2 family endonuclease [Paludisphaera soli]|uniref:Uma2 family endonuclease n=1 Tax=Paludisphaera soli TaxID=2712865 RepID=UPI0013EB37AB|nr:Uma2 family endonuclease [Paludisphaera soli]